MSKFEIKVSNTQSGQKETLKTVESGHLRMYSCGPTVYGLIHIGNLRAALVPDMFFKFFRRAGYKVTFVRNYTDVDDKIIKAANEAGLSSSEHAKKYIAEVEKDYALAGVENPTHKTLVTEHMPEIIAMVKTLIDRGHAYVVNGEVLYSVESFEAYGKLSGRKLDDQQAGARVGVRDLKRNPLDFTLWKPAKPGEPSWESPWGPGRPGWHIECSAMSSKWLGDQMDIHHGGEDLVFPHHENEIAQSEGASGRAPFVRYWMHNAFLTMSKEKMSKSLGNVMTARDFLTQYSGEFARYLLLSAHYRSMIDFSDESVDHTLTSLQRIYEAKLKAEQMLKAQTGNTPTAGLAWSKFAQDAQKTIELIDAHFANDFNTAGALSELFSLIREFNRLSKEAPEAGVAGEQGARALIRVMNEPIAQVIGVAGQEASKALQDLERIRKMRAQVDHGGAVPEAEILEAIQKRLDARKAKDFALADQIRKDLDARGVLLKDGPQGTSWQYK